MNEKQADFAMTRRQQDTLHAMLEAMRARFIENEWRERMPFPSVETLLLRSQRAILAAYAQCQIGEQELALSHAADAANLVGLAVIFGKCEKP